MRPEIINTLSPLMPSVVLAFDRASGSRTKGKTRAVTIAEAQESAARNKLTIVGACWYDEENGSYSHYIAVDKNNSIHLLSLMHGASSWREASVEKTLKANPGKTIEEIDWLVPLTREEEKAIPLEYNMEWIWTCQDEGPYVFSGNEAEYENTIGQFINI